MGSLAAGVTVVTTLDETGVPCALTATAFSSLSAEPPLCLVCVDKQARANLALHHSRRFAVNLLRDSQAHLSTHFASAVSDKFADVAHELGGVTGCPLLEGTLAAIECEVTEAHAGGDHDIFIGLVVSARIEQGMPLVYWRGVYSRLRPLAR